MNYGALTKHADYPFRVSVVVEQPRGLETRMGYDVAKGGFYRTESRHLLFVRGFTGVYGWIAGTGVPPAPHWDILLFTEQEVPLGGCIDGNICGVFYRADGDHKFVAVDDALRACMTAADIAALPPDKHRELLALYPKVGDGEGWRTAEEARRILSKIEPLHD